MSNEETPSDAKSWRRPSTDGMMLGTEVTAWSMLNDRFLQHAVEAPYVRSAQWSVNLAAFPTFEDSELLVGQYQFHANQHRVLGTDGGDGVFYLQLSSGTVQVEACAADAAGVEEMLVELRRLFPVYEYEAPDVVPMNVWMAATGGGTSLRRDITVPRWPELDGNYTADTKAALDTLMAEDWRPSSGGQLLLWHGEPGTGKTYALRALAREWRDWCELHYVSDPENMFGSTAYLLQVAAGDDRPTFHMDSDDEDEDEGLTKPQVEQKWRLLVLEDSGELMRPDAKQNVGQALSRLLNLVDGLLGQGLRTLVLVTTNEELHDLHPAVKRPGRCAAVVHFGKLNGSETREWYQREGLPADGPGVNAGEHTLAELFEERDKLTIQADRKAPAVRDGMYL